MNPPVPVAPEHFPTYPLLLIHGDVKLAINNSAGYTMCAPQLALQFVHMNAREHLSFRLSDPKEIYALTDGFLWRKLSLHYLEYCRILRSICSINPDGDLWLAKLGADWKGELITGKQGLDSPRALRYNAP